LLVKLAVADSEAQFGARLYGLVLNTFTLAGVAALVAVAVALLLAYAGRTVKHPLVHITNRFAVLGYALPGAVIAVGILLPLGKLDNILAAWVQEQLGVKTGLLLTGSMVALIYAYVVRFLAVAFQTAEAGLTRVTLSMDDAARSLGYSPAQTLWRVHVPIISGSLATAALLVFVDVMKELPATFAMRWRPTTSPRTSASPKPRFLRSSWWRSRWYRWCSFHARSLVRGGMSRHECTPSK
jgi:iron(III) transport system permease protein